MIKTGNFFPFLLDLIHLIEVNVLFKHFNCFHISWNRIGKMVLINELKHIITYHERSNYYKKEKKDFIERTFINFLVMCHYTQAMIYTGKFQRDGIIASTINCVPRKFNLLWYNKQKNALFEGYMNKVSVNNNSGLKNVFFFRTFCEKNKWAKILNNWYWLEPAESNFQFDWKKLFWS